MTAAIKWRKDTSSTGTIMQGLTFPASADTERPSIHLSCPCLITGYKRKSLHDVPPNITFLEDRAYLVDHPDYRKERGGAISFHIKVMALSMIGLIMNHNKDAISRQQLQYHNH